RHHTPYARTREGDASMISDLHAFPDPSVLHKAPGLFGRAHDHVRAETASLEPPLRIQFLEFGEGRRCEQMQRCQVEEGPRWHRLFGDFLAVGETFDVRPILLVSRRVRSGRHEPDGPAQSLRQDSVDVRGSGFDHRSVGHVTMTWGIWPS